MSQCLEVDLLRQVESYPFTNVTRLYRFAGTLLPDAVGGGCLWLAARLARLLHEHRPDLKLTHHDLGTPGSHLLTLSDDGREKLVYEPSLFQVQPFSLTRFEVDPNHRTSDVFPPLDPCMKLRFSRPGPAELRVELVSPRGHVQRVFVHRLDVAAKLDENDPYAGLPFMEPQDQIYVHLLNPDGIKTILMMNVQTGHITVGRVREHLYVDTEPGFATRFQRIAERMELSEAGLRDLLSGARDILHSHYPNSGTSEKTSRSGSTPRGISNDV
jgi:hypothetical protein